MFEGHCFGVYLGNEQVKLNNRANGLASWLLTHHHCKCVQESIRKTNKSDLITETIQHNVLVVRSWVRYLLGRAKRSITHG